MNRLYPIGIQNFEKLRKGGFVYVDKTALIHRLFMLTRLRLYIVLSLQVVIISSVVLAVSARV